MAATMRASSFLPTIKCSQCSVEIPISHMGDHVCSRGAKSQIAFDPLDNCSSFAASPKSESRSQTLDGSFAPATRVPMGPASSSLRSGKTVPVRSNTIDTGVSGRTISGSALKNAIPIDEMPPPPRPPFSSHSTASSSGRISPALSLSGRKSPHRKIMRSETAPLATRSSSPDAMPLPQDSAFPIFPTAKSRSTTPTTPHKTSFGFPTEIKKDMSAHDRYVPSSPQGDKDENALDRMRSTTPGPFNAQGMEVRQPSGAEDASAVNNGREFSRSTSTSTSGSRVRALSTSSSNYTRNPSMSSTAGYTRLDLEKSEVPAVPTVPSVALHHNVSQLQDLEEPTNRYTTDASPFDFGSLSQPSRAHTFPEDGKPKESLRRPSDPTHTSSAQEEQAVSRKPSNPPEMIHKSKPSVMLPLYEIGSTSSFKPSKSLRGRRNGSPTAGQLDVSQLKKTSPQEGKMLGDVPPLPQPLNTPLYDISNPYHTPHESVSSNESYGSGAKSGSSRSSPPLNSPLKSSSPQQKGQFASDGFNDAFQGFQFGVESQSEPEQLIPEEGAAAPTSAPSQSFTPPESQEPSIPTLSSPPHSIWPMPPSVSHRPTTPIESQHPSLPVESQHPSPPMESQQQSPPTSASPQRSVRPVKPALAPLRNVPTRSMVSPMVSPEDYLTSPASPFTDPVRNIRMSPGLPTPPPIPESPGRKRVPRSKGQCRGCNAAIYGKSISSADGQLTGRYHKQCFVCKTCNAPFQTTDFYVHNNNPYCGRHYHEQNGSLCTNCDRGIEGQYLETDQMQKYHPYCFTCQECHRILRDDFYEWNNRILCEQHAFGDAQGAAQQPSSLGPGRRYPERRTTKLMMM